MTHRAIRPRTRRHQGFHFLLPDHYTPMSGIWEHFLDVKFDFVTCFTARVVGIVFFVGCHVMFYSALVACVGNISRLLRQTIDVTSGLSLGAGDRRNSTPILPLIAGY
jgi:hypothetical protein